MTNPFAPVEPLDEEQLSLIHDASMRLIEEQGIQVLGDLALDTFRQAGAKVSADGIVTMDRSLLMEAVTSAPKRFTLTPRNPDNALDVGDNVIHLAWYPAPPVSTTI